MGITGEKTEREVSKVITRDRNQIVKLARGRTGSTIPQGIHSGEKRIIVKTTTNN